VCCFTGKGTKHTGKEGTTNNRVRVRQEGKTNEEGMEGKRECVGRESTQEKKVKGKRTSTTVQKKPGAN